jgi:predicted amidohydrolase YtcJ
VVEDVGGRGPRQARVFANCRAYTLDAANTIAEAIVVRDALIEAACSVEDARRIAPNAEWVDLGGKTVVPGFIDSHNHLLHFGISATRAADLSGCTSIEELLNRLRGFRSANPQAPWLLGQRFDQELLGRWPTKADLDLVSPDSPAMVTRLCLHALVANSAALAPVKSKLSREQFETGILTEDATGLIWSQLPDPTEKELTSAALWAMSEARRVGLTGVHCIIEGAQDLQVIRSLHREHLTPVRLTVICPFSMREQLSSEGLRTGAGDEWLRIGGLKVFLDGAMGARTAAMREPFSDDPGNCGTLFRNERELAEVLRDAQTHGFQASIHAIGDRAVECALEGIGLAKGHANEGNGLRHRVEHASQMAGDLVKQMARMNVIAGVQPQFVLTDFWTHERVGPERYRWSYPFKTMLDAGITLAMGSDCPVERLDPVELIDRAVNREPRSLHERLSVEETLRAYSRGSAYAGFAEDVLGALEPGKLADFVVLSADIFAVRPKDVADIKIEATVVGGEMRDRSSK